MLGEIVTQTLVASGRPAVHRQGLGNTGILEQALASGAVDVYPEYTGTIVRELLKREGNPSLDELNRWLAPRGLVAAVPFGFNNTYALAMSEARAKSLGIARISDLASAQAARLQARPVARVPAARRRLAGAAPGLCADADADRPRPRPGVRRGRGRQGRRDRRLLDRRQARPPRPAGARGRPRLLPQVRRGAADAQGRRRRRRCSASRDRSTPRP